VAEESRRVVWRRRIAPIALLIALGLLATRTCGAERTSVELSFDVGAAAERVRELQVTVHRLPAEGADTPVAQWTGRPSAGVLRPWKLHLDPGGYRLRFRADVGGRMVRFDRTIDVRQDEARITVPVADAL
jgi:hypothetical protein